MYNIIGLSTYLPEQDMATQLDQVYTDVEAENDYYNAFYHILTTLNKRETLFIKKTEDTSSAESQGYLKCILADFSPSQRNGFLRAVADIYGDQAKEIMGKKLAGCLVHFSRRNFCAIHSRVLPDENKDILVKL